MMEENENEEPFDNTGSGVGGTDPADGDVSARRELAGQVEPLSVRRITVRTGRLVCDVVVADPELRQTTPRLASFITRHYPDLPLHACVNEVGVAFGSVIEHTSIPHMLEHLVIDIQAANTSHPASTFVGTSEWTDPEAGEASIEIGFLDDLEALRAFSEATRFLNMAMVTCFA